jgi:hypothetical protein
MDAFEQIVARAFEARGYWTRIGFKVDLDKATKKALKNPSMPRPEIDVLAYRPAKQELLMIECKSYLDSPGVQYAAFATPDSVTASRYKLFNNPPLFEAVKTQVIKQLAGDCLLIGPTPRVQLCLVAGKIYGTDESQLKRHFEERGWMFVPPSAVVADLRLFADRGYENDIVTVTVKLLERNLPKQDHGR